jgi:hypothetical protein
MKYQQIKVYQKVGKYSTVSASIFRTQTNRQGRKEGRKRQKGRVRLIKEN